MNLTKNRTVAIGAVLAMCMTAFAGMCIVTDESDGAAATPGSTVSFTWYDFQDEDMITASEGLSVDTIFGWSVNLEPVHSGSTTYFTIPNYVANGTYTYVQSLFNEEAGEEMDYKAQTLTVTGQKGTSASNYYQGDIVSSSSVGAYQNKTIEVWVKADCHVDFDVLQWNRENRDILTVTPYAGLEISTVNSYTKQVSGTLIGDCTVTAMTWDNGSYDTLKYVFHVVGAHPNGTAEQPLTSLSRDADDIIDKTYYVAVGSYVELRTVADAGGFDEFWYQITGVTPGFGLTYDSSANPNGGFVGGVVSGTISKPGTITISGDYLNGSLEGDLNCRIIAVGDPVTVDHTVTYAANGGTGTTASTVVTDENDGNSNVTLAQCGFTKTGYSFVGWKIGNTVYQPGQTVSVGANATVTATAQWSQNTLSVSANNISGVSKLTYTNQIGASANNGASLSYAVKSCTGGNATVNSNGLVTYTAPSVSSTTSFTVTVTVTGTFAQGGNLTRDVSFTVTVDPVLSFTNAATSGTLSVKGA